MSLRSAATVARRRALAGLRRSVSFPVGAGTVRFAPVRRQSRLLDELVDHGIWGYEPELAHFIYRNPFSSVQFIDGGAHIALFSILAERSGRYRKITAIEAQPRAVEYIRRLKQLNDLTFDLQNCALGEREEDLTFEIPETGYAMPSHSAFVVSELYKQQPKRKISVAAKPLKTFVEAGPTLIKLDCEGAEERILRAMADQLQARTDLDLIVEIMINDRNKNDVFELLTSLGYSAYLMTNGGFVSEDRALTLPVPGALVKRAQARTIWRNHFFTKRAKSEVDAVSLDLFGYSL